MINKDGIGYKTDMNSSIICVTSSWIYHLAHGVLVISQTRITFTASGLVSKPICCCLSLLYVVTVLRAVAKSSN